jgi:4-hydroxybenzoate polyprenyltransferase
MHQVMTLAQRLDAYERLMRLDRPAGMLLLLWPTLWGLWFAARGEPAINVLVIFVIGVALTRSAGCVINDLADRRFDPHVKRTRDRPLAAGAVQPAEAVGLAAGLLLLAFSLVLQLGRQATVLSFAALAIMTIYPFLKRFFVLPQAWLGVAFGFGIPMAYAAQLALVPPMAWWLLAANVFWAIAYDTEYAMVDRDDDLKLGLKSSAILLGRHDVAGVMIAHAAFLGLMALAGYWNGVGLLYHAGLAIALGLVARQYWLIRGRDRDRCFQAFRENNWLGLVIFAGLALDLYVRYA